METLEGYDKRNACIMQHIIAVRGLLICFVNNYNSSLYFELQTHKMKIKLALMGFSNSVMI